VPCQRGAAPGPVRRFGSVNTSLTAKNTSGLTIGSHGAVTPSKICFLCTMNPALRGCNRISRRISADQSAPVTVGTSPLSRNSAASARRLIPCNSRCEQSAITSIS
jgi:hypothetical protein